MIDVAINVYGKPYQTLISLLTLLKHSGKWIDKIYLTYEKKLSHGDIIDWIESYLPKEKLIVFTPESFIACAADMGRLNEKEYRLSIRYQYAWEKSDKEFLFILHNDMIFKGDIIGRMMRKIGENAGIGKIGQCWNCPAKTVGVCDSEKFNTFKPSYEEAIKIVKETHSPRMKVKHIDRENPMPFPECRVNEWAFLINLKKVKDEVLPLGDTVPLGCTHPFHDTGSEWFRSLVLKGYKFIHWDGEHAGAMVHAPFTRVALGGGGNFVDAYKEKYLKIKETAKKYFEDNFDNANK